MRACSYAPQTPRDTSAATPAEEPSRASFLSLLRDLYSDTGAAGRAADGGDATPAPSQPDDPQEHDEHDEDRDGAEEEEDADLRGSMGAVDEILAAQEARRLELSAYMANLQVRDAFGTRRAGNVADRTEQGDGRPTRWA